MTTAGTGPTAEVELSIDGMTCASCTARGGRSVAMVGDGANDATATAQTTSPRTDGGSSPVSRGAVHLALMVHLLTNTRP